MTKENTTERILRDGLSDNWGFIALMLLLWPLWVVGYIANVVWNALSAGWIYSDDNIGALAIKFMDFAEELRASRRE